MASQDTSVWAVVHAQAKTSETRPKIIEALQTSARTTQGEIGALDYIIAVPVPGEDDGTSIYMIEHDASKEAAEEHRNGSAFRAFGQTVMENLGWFAGPSTPRIFAPVASFSRDSLKSYSHEKLYVRFVSGTCTPGTSDKTIEYLKGVVSATETSEKGTLAYVFAHEQEQANPQEQQQANAEAEGEAPKPDTKAKEPETKAEEKLAWIEMFESKDYYENTHSNNQVILDMAVTTLCLKVEEHSFYGRKAHNSIKP